jgi:hypothetical protein
MDSRSEPAVDRIEILNAFIDLPDVRKASGKRHYMALCLALFTLLKTVQANFVAEASYTEISKGHGRLEKRVISLCTTLEGINPWPGLKTIE